MPRSITAAFTAEKNKLENKPIWLYRIVMDPENPGNDWYLAECSEDISFFRTDNGAHTAQVYRAYPIQHGGIAENNQGRLDSVTVSVANVNREIQSALENYDGLRGKTVVIRLVFRDLLSDPQACMEDIFTIDAVPSATDTTVQFTLVGRMDALNARTLRRFARHFCPWEYKGLGCWLDNGDGTFSRPSTDAAAFEQTLVQLIDGYERYTNTDKGQLATPLKLDNKILKWNLSFLNAATDSLIFSASIWSEELTSASIDRLWVYLGSAGARTSNCYRGYFWRNIATESPTTYWPFAGVIGLDAWTTVEIPLSYFYTPNGAPDLYAINYFGLSATVSSSNATCDKRVKIKNVYLKHTPAETAAGGWNPGADTCNHSFENCKLHNNTARFGGFPTIPSGRTYVAY